MDRTAEKGKKILGKEGKRGEVEEPIGGKKKGGVGEKGKGGLSSPPPISHRVAGKGKH